jgi:high affinity sulfate transporter 1
MIGIVPSIGWLREYRKEWLRPDIVAGLTTSAVVIPQAMAYAAIAGLPVEVGLYAALVPMLTYVFLGTSRPLSVSSTSTIAILVAAQLSMAVPNGDRSIMLSAAVTLTMLTGGFLLLAGVLRLGFLANLISDPVLAGFKAGIGLVIVVGQLPKLLGLHIIKVGFFRDLWSIAEQTPQAHGPTVVVGAVMLGILFGLKRVAPRVPAPLVAAVLGILAAWLLPLKSAAIALTGNIPSGIPTPVLPDLGLVWTLCPGALAVALMSFTESIAAGRAFARSGEPRPEANQELRALGLANLGGGLFQSMPAGGGTSQTAVNARAGARTQVAQLVTVAVVVAVLLFLAPAVALLPQATLAAIVVVAAISLLNPTELCAIARIRHMELWWGLVAFAGVVVLGTLPGILTAVAMSLLALMYHANRPPVYAVGRERGTRVFVPLSDASSDAETFPGLLIVRTEGRMTFASAPQVAERLWNLIHAANPRVLVLECSAIPDFEYTALKALAGFQQRLREDGITLWLAGLNPEPKRVIARSPLSRALGTDRIFANLPQAVERYLSTAAAIPGDSPVSVESPHEGERK